MVCSISRIYKPYSPAVKAISYKHNPRDFTTYIVRIFTKNHAGNKIRQNLQYGNPELLYTSGEAVHVGFEVDSGTGTVLR